jgi:uncharacterized RDD family membrane protein YckC
MTATAPARPLETPEEIAHVVTPESVPVRFTVARMGDRIAAFGIDAAILVMALIVVGLLGGAISSAGGVPEIATAAVILGAFLHRNFYFTWFEIRRQGQTPGKKRLFLRVIDRRGGSLSAEAVFVRNVMREIEFFIPLAALFAPHLLFPMGGGQGQLLALAWVFVLAALPFFNRQRLRVGDLVAGTMVVRLPRPSLLPDLSAASSAREPAHAFTPEQLDVYGIYELQVLEDLLRRTPDEAWRQALAAVGEKIRKKIGYDAAPTGMRRYEGAEAEAFLRDFYAAQRARLEGKLIFGTRRERKAD